MTGRTFDELIRLPADAIRRRLFVTRRYDNRRPPDGRPKFNRDELVKYLTEKDFRTSRQLEAGRKPGEPSVNDYRRVFGSWSLALDSVFGNWDGVAPPDNRMYLVRTVLEFGLWTRSRYRQARKERPDVIPSMSVVCREFDSFSVLKRLAAAKSLSRSMSDYLALKKRLGRRPTVAECARGNIDLEAMRSMFGGKRQLDMFLASMKETG